MDISAVSMALSQSKAMQQVAIAMQRNAMDVVETQMQGLVDMMQSASPASLGPRLDVRA